MKNKIGMIFLVIISILLLVGTGYNVYAKYVLSKKISISFTTADYYFDVEADETEITSLPATVNVTVKNNDGTNYTDTDLNYSVSASSSDLVIDISENTGTLTGGSKQEKSFTVTISLADGVDTVSKNLDLEFDISTPYTDSKKVALNVVYSSSGYTVVWTNNTTANRTIDGQTATYKNPIIPVGFSAVDTDDAKWNKSNGALSDWNEGLVIKNATDGNEFVWIPVDGTDVIYAKWCTSGTSYSNCTDVASTSGLDVADNVTNYGGFWVARYEAGLPTTISQTTASSDVRNVSGAPLSRAGAVPWNYISYTNSKANAELMYANDYVQSGLVNGTQWDTIALWLKNAGYDVTDSASWGNYNNSTVTLRENYAYISTDYGASWTSATSTTSKASQLIKTGASNDTKANNIYDLAGNLREWTDEMASKNYIIRGGRFSLSGTTYPVIYRATSSDATGWGLGFRVQLYVK